MTARAPRGYRRCPKPKILRTVRVGLAHLVAVSGEAIRAGHAGAFVEVVGRSRSPSAFRRDVRRVMEHLGFRLLELTEVETASARFGGRAMPRWMCDLAHEVRPGQVGWGTFHRHPTAQLPPRARRLAARRR